MPELPEVETVVRELAPLAGDTLREIRVRDARVWFESELKPEAFNGLRLLEVRRRGKYIIWRFEKLALVQHLRMTGKMLPAGSAALPAKLEGNLQIRLELRFARGGTYYFYDTRRFGTFTAVRDLAKFWERKAQAPDPVNADELESARVHYHKKITGRDRPIKSALLDQTIISGVGNIYADEVLHRERVHPRTPVRRLGTAELERIFETLRVIFAEAISQRGTSAFNYLGVNGQPGEFAKFLRVYQRTGELCVECGKGRIESFPLGGRTSHFCPICQPLAGKAGKRPASVKKPATKTPKKSKLISRKAAKHASH